MEILIFADSRRSADMRHMVPVSIGDPFVYVEHNGQRVAFASSHEVPRLRQVEGLEVVSFEELGQGELRARGLPRRAIQLEVLHRACGTLGFNDVAVPPDFPIDAADFLRSRGMRIQPDSGVFAERRRAKTPHEIEGIRRAQVAAQVAMKTIRDAVRRGGTFSSESLRASARREAATADVSFEVMIVAHGPQSASVHEPGSGRIVAGEPIVVDLGVRDRSSGMWSDMSRTFCLGEPPEQLVVYHRLCREVHERVTPMVRAGASCAELHRRADALIAEAGYPTMLTKDSGAALLDGFLHTLGHGVGLELHEPPSVGPNGEDLVAGDVITIEPGVYQPGFGGCRLEDLLLVTDTGYELLTDFPYDL